MATDNRWPLLTALCLGIAAILIFWYYAEQPRGPWMPAPGGRYREAMVGAPARINPLYAALNDVDRALVALVFSGLTRLDGQGRVLSDVAEGWEISPDGTRYTFHLRRDVFWHDGTPLTADDVLFTWEALKDKDFQGDPSLARLARDVAMTKVDDYTVIARLPEPFAPFLAYASLGIVPKHLLDGRDARQLFQSPFNQSPIGTGPFRLVKLSGQQALLEANPSYHLGSPYLATIEIRFYPDQRQAVAALLDGEVDGIFLSPGLEQEQLVQLEQEPDLRLLYTHPPAYTLVYLNARSLLFQDRRVRQALLHGIDRDRIVREVLRGQGRLADGPIAPGTWAYDPSTKPYPFAPDKARELLAEAGWRLNDRGLWEKDGLVLRFTLVTNDHPLRTAVAQALAQQWRQIGVEVQPYAVGATALAQDYLLPRRYEAALFGWDPGYDPDPYPAWHSSQSSPNGNNLADYKNEALDKLMVQARQVNDPEQRRPLYYRFQDLFAQELPSLPLYYPLYTYAQRQKVRGVQLGVLFDPGARFFNVQEWYVKVKRASS